MRVVPSQGVWHHVYTNPSSWAECVTPICVDMMYVKTMSYDVCDRRVYEWINVEQGT